MIYVKIYFIIVLPEFCSVYMTIHKNFQLRNSFCVDFLLIVVSLPFHKEQCFFLDNLSVENSANLLREMGYTHIVLFSIISLFFYGVTTIKFSIHTQ